MNLLFCFMSSSFDSSSNRSLCWSSRFLATCRSMDEKESITRTTPFKRLCLRKSIVNLWNQHVMKSNSSTVPQRQTADFYLVIRWDTDSKVSPGHKVFSLRPTSNRFILLHLMVGRQLYVFCLSAASLCCLSLMNLNRSYVSFHISFCFSFLILSFVELVFLTSRVFQRSFHVVIHSRERLSGAYL